MFSTAMVRWNLHSRMALKTVITFGLRPKLLRWVTVPTLASALAGGNARLLLRILRDTLEEGAFALVFAFAFAAIQYGMVVRLLGKKIDEIA